MTREELISRAKTLGGVATDNGNTFAIEDAVEYISTMIRDCDGIREVHKDSTDPYEWETMMGQLDNPDTEFVYQVINDWKVEMQIALN